jgi:membrane-associated phospholipid phosphatase
MILLTKVSPRLPSSRPVRLNESPAMDLFISYLSKIDLALFHAINGWCGRSLTLDDIAKGLESFQLKGLAFISTFGALWFRRSKTQIQQRETLVLLLFAIVLSLIVARSVADLAPFRARPMVTSGIEYRTPLIRMEAYFENWSAFPSDTAAIVFAMTTGFWLLSRWWGLLWATFSTMAVLARVYFGLHYPGDVLAGALIGTAVTLAINNEFTHAHIAAPIVAVEQRSPAIFYGLLFPFIYEVSTLFSYLRGMYHAISQVLFHAGS